MNTCKSCKNWRPIREGYGECHKIMDHSGLSYRDEDAFPNKTQAVLWATLAYNLNEVDEWASNLTMLEGEQITKAGYAIDASLMTRERFGCILHEEGPNKE